MVDLPLVPVTPISISRLDGSPYTQEATSPSRARGSATTNTGSPQCAARLLPSGSVSTATAPASAASSQNAAPWCWRPGSAAYRSPGCTRRESCVTPDTVTGPAWPGERVRPGPPGAQPEQHGQPGERTRRDVAWKESRRHGPRLPLIHGAVSRTLGRLPPSGGIFRVRSANSITLLNTGPATSMPK